MYKKLIVLFLLFVFLTGCTKNTIGKEKPETIAHNAHKESNLIYNKHQINLPDSNVTMRFAERNKKSIFIYGQTQEGQHIFYLYNVSTQEFLKLNIKLKDNVAAITISEDGSLSAITYKNIPDSNDLDYNLIEIDGNGDIYNIEGLNNLSKYDQTAIIGLLAVNNGYLIRMVNSIILLENYEVVKVFEYKGLNKQIVKTGNNKIIICGMENNNYIIEELSTDNKSKTKYILDSNFKLAFDGIESDEICLADSNYIYTVNYKTETLKIIANININSINLHRFIYLSENEFFTLQNGFPHIWSLNEDGISNITVLTMATFHPSMELADAISKYNNENEKYKIDFIDYSSYNSTNESGLDLLRTQIISGNIPDIFDISNLPDSMFSSLKILENIKPYIDNYNKDNILVKNILDTLTKDSSIYSFVPGFRIVTMLGDKNFISGISSWSPEQFLSVAEQNKNIDILAEYISREAFLEYMLVFDGTNHIDFKKGTCNFNNEDFTRLLEYAAGLPSEAMMDHNHFMMLMSQELLQILNRQQLFAILKTGTLVESLLVYNALYNANGVFTGFPTSTGTGTALLPFMQLGMSASSQNKEGVWDFFQFLLSETYQNTIYDYQSIPIVTSILNQRLNGTIAHFEKNPLRIAVPDGVNETIVDCLPADGSLNDKAWELINQIDCIYSIDPSIYNIVLDEAEAYFTGQKDIRSIVELIQSRVSIYLSERS